MPDFYARLHRRYGRREVISRREMIQRSLAATAGVLLSEQFTAAQGKPRRVVVIGAGFSGLAAASGCKAPARSILPRWAGSGGRRLPMDLPTFLTTRGSPRSGSRNGAHVNADRIEGLARDKIKPWPRSNWKN